VQDLMLNRNNHLQLARVVAMLSPNVIRLLPNDVHLKGMKAIRQIKYY
jgi:hypothetical protein